MVYHKDETSLYKKGRKVDKIQHIPMHIMHGDISFFALVENPPSITNLKVALGVVQGSILLLTGIGSWETHLITRKEGWKDKLTQSPFATN